MAYPPLDLTVRPSRRLTAAVLGAHALAAVAVFPADLAWAYRTALLAAVLASLTLFLLQRREIRIRCGQDGSLAVFQEDEWRPAILQADSTVLSWLVVLRYRAQGGRRVQACVAIGDSMDSGDFRRLRVWARWRGVQGSATFSQCEA